MKKLLFVTLISAITSFAMMAGNVIKKGDTQSALGKYAIEETDDFVEVDGQTLPTYIIRFENSDQTLKIVVHNEKKGNVRNFIVLGDNLNMQYTCEKAYFGVRPLDNKYVEAGIKKTSEKLSRKEYLYQRVITRSNPTSRDCIGLIACYYPKLVVDFENEFACLK